jgi:hypothetical protein
MNNEYLRRLFRVNIGTSFAAPRVAYLAARLFGYFPTGSANLIRALLVSSASIPDASKNLLENLGKDAVINVCGYGRPSLSHAALSSENRVVLYSDTQIKYDHFHVYHVPIPEEFFDQKGDKSISVSLAFDPPVRHTRFDYLGVTMSFRLIRGKSAEDVVEAFRKLLKDEEDVDSLTSTKYNCKMYPTPTTREGGTLQKAVFVTPRNYKKDYGQDYFLVVRCEKKWALEDVYGEQRYSVVMTMEHSEPLNIYARIQQRIEVPVRLRARY